MADESINGNSSSFPQIGEYVIEGLLAKGAMGEVYKALDPILNREVAIKVLAPSLMSDEDAINRFQREAKATAKIRHKNVAIIYSVGNTVAGAPYMAMEFVNGVALSELIENKTDMLYSQATDMLIQCCQGLEAAKREGVIHRDIKPSNIMILAKGEVKLVDFGLAKIFRDESFRTIDNMVMGTPAYMSPEQSLGHKSIDFRSDIYSLGASFYHLLSGELPFEGDSPVQLMMKHVNTPLRSINVINPKVPHDLSDIVHCMMNKDREYRYQDYEELIHELKKVKVTCLSKERAQGLAAASLLIPVADSENLSSENPEVESKDQFESAPSGWEDRPSSEPSQFSMLDDLTGDSSDDGFADFQETYRIPAAHSSSEYEQAVQAVRAGRPHEPATGNLRILEAGASDPVREPMLWWQKGLLVLLLLLCGFAIVASAIKPSAAADENPRERKSLLALMIQSLAGKEKIELRDTPEMIQLRQYNITRERLTELEIALQQFEAREGVLPASLRQLVNINAISSEYLTDAWNNRFSYIRLNKLVVSFGPDNIEGTSDDITLTVDGSGIVMPQRYTQLQSRVKEQEAEHLKNKPR